MHYHFLGHKLEFPHPETADEHGIVAIGGDLSVERLVLAYRHGIFPWFNDDEPVLWWSPDPRFVLFPKDLKVGRSLRKVIRNKGFEVRFDTAFDQVIAYCARLPRPGQGGTWITEEMRQAYLALHQTGWAHSVEVWLNNQLVGGLYGVAMGRFFFGESMFYLEPNASKVALYHLCTRFEKAPLIDCQVANPFFADMGAVHVHRRDFLKVLAYYIDQPSLWHETQDYEPIPP